MHFYGTQLYLSFQSDNPTSYHISACLSNISVWIKDCHLQHNIAKTELLVNPTNQSVDHNITLQMGSTTSKSNKTATWGLCLRINWDFSPTFQQWPIVQVCALQHQENWPSEYVAHLLVLDLVNRTSAILWMSDVLFFLHIKAKKNHQKTLHNLHTFCSSLVEKADTLHLLRAPF